MKYLFSVNACRWFDKVNGNTYNSTRIVRFKDGAVLVTPFQYGYGDYYRQAALKAMMKAGWLPEKYSIQLLWNVSDGLKRDCVKNGTL